MKQTLEEKYTKHHESGGKIWQLQLQLVGTLGGILRYANYHPVVFFPDFADTRVTAEI